MYLDYRTGAHKRLLGDALHARGAYGAGRARRTFVAVPPSSDHANVPQLLFTLDSQSLQGQDCARRQLEERHTCLRGAKVETVLRIADCSEHSFDVKDGSEATFGGQFDEEVEFLCSALVNA